MQLGLDNVPERPAKGRNIRPRLPGDAYYTPGKPVRQVLDLLRTEYGLGQAMRNPLWRCVEPSCGAGHIIDQLRGFGGIAAERITGIDTAAGGFSRIRDLHRGVQLVHGDFLKWRPARPVDLVIGNPPYGDQLPERFVRHCMSWAERPRLIAFLLRAGWAASQDRYALHREFPSDLNVLAERPSFTNDGGTDGQDYAWFIWSAGSDGGRWRVIGPADPAQTRLSLL